MESRFVILMSDNRKLNDDLEGSDYNSLSSFINFKYSQKHNFELVYLNPQLTFSLFQENNCLSPTNQLRHPSWSKLLSTFKIMRSSKEWTNIVYLDTDCIFSDHSLSISDYLHSSVTIGGTEPNLDKIIFMNNKPWQSDLPCAGFYIIPNNQIGQQFIIDWFNNDDHAYSNQTHPWEQKSLQLSLLHKYSDQIDIIDDWMFVQRPNQFIRHIGSHEKQNRITTFKDIILKNWSEEDYTKTISNLKNSTLTYATDKMNFLE